MATACAQEEISNESLQFILPNHRADITQLLRELKAEGLLESDGYGRGTRYHIPQGLIERSNNGSTEANNGSLGRTSSRLSPKERELAIWDYASGIYRSATEIAQHLHLSVDYVQRKFISNMVKDGRLTCLYPDKGTHPYQKYTSVR